MPPTDSAALELAQIGKIAKGKGFERRVIKQPKCFAACNGEYALKYRPKSYAKAVKMLADPAYTFRDIAKATGFHYRTLRAIMEREQVPIEKQKQILRRQYSRTLRRLADRVEDTADRMKPRDAIFGISVLSDKLALLTGSPTSHALNLNVNASVDVVAQFRKLHKAIEEKANKAELKEISEEKSGAVDTR
jgi:hypothetical protein